MREDLQTRALPAMENLLQSPPDQLYEQLGLRHKAIEVDPLQAGLFQTTASYDADFAGPLDALREIGQNFFNRFSKDAYGLVCGGDSENKTQRDKLVEAFGGGKVTFAAALAAAFVSYFGWAPAIAAVMAALVVRLFLGNFYKSTCEVWQRRLPK